MKIFAKAKKQREYDGMWETLGLVKNYDQRYEYMYQNQKVVLVPDKWITIDVTREEPNV